MAVMTPFELRIELKTPIVLGAKAPRLDGLLWHCLFLETGSSETAQSQLSDYLHFEHDIFHASSLAFAVNQRAPAIDLGDTEKASQQKEPALLALTRTTVGAMRSNDLQSHMFRPNGTRKKQPYPNLQVNGGPFGTRLKEHKAYWSDGLIFKGHGYGEHIAAQLEYYLVGVGVNANIGFGSIGRVKSTDAGVDHSVIGEDGKPARPIPTTHPRANELGRCAIDDAKLIPPFWQVGEHVLCYMPDRVKIQRV